MTIFFDICPGDNFSLAELLRDEARVKNYLVNSGALDSVQAEDFINSVLNLTNIVHDLELNRIGLLWDTYQTWKYGQ